MDTQPPLPPPRGVLSEELIGALSGHLRLGRTGIPPDLIDRSGDGIFGEDLQLSLYLLYELHYRGFREVDEALEWDPDLLALRSALEADFEARLRELIPAEDAHPDPAGLGGKIADLIAEDDGPPLSNYVEARATLDQVQEFLLHRSAYQLKEADPHTWAIPRLEGPPKAAMVEVQADEYGGGRPDRVHATLFAKAMRAVDLDPSYGAYLDRIPAVTLATVNLMSMCGLHRRLRGAIVGHLAGFEMTSPLPNARYARGLRRLGFGEDALDFFDEHVEADSVHENIALYDLAQGLAIREPELAGDILFGVRSLLLLDARFGAYVLGCWERSTSSLLEPVGSPR
jgi:Iron-containing redox enzyme